MREAAEPLDEPETDDSICDFCGTNGTLFPEVEYYRVRGREGLESLVCDSCVDRVGPFAEYDVFLDEVDWVVRTVSRLAPGSHGRPTIAPPDASARVTLRFSACAGAVRRAPAVEGDAMSDRPPRLHAGRTRSWIASPGRGEGRSPRESPAPATPL